MNDLFEVAEGCDDEFSDLQAQREIYCSSRGSFVPEAIETNRYVDFYESLDTVAGLQNDSINDLIDRIGRLECTAIESRQRIADLENKICALQCKLEDVIAEHYELGVRVELLEEQMMR